MRGEPRRGKLGRVRRALAVLLLVLTLPGARAVQACKLLSPAKHLSDETRRATDTQPPRFTSPPTVEVQRAVKPGGTGCHEPSHGNCDEIGRIRIKVPVSDDQTPVAECGFRLTLVSGRLPDSVQLPTHDVRAFDGEIPLQWFDPGGEGSLSFVVSVAPIDAAANLGETVNLTVSSGDGGCSIVPGARSGMCLVLLVLLWCGLRRAGRATSCHRS